jgi:hypothetical protein
MRQPSPSCVPADGASNNPVNGPPATRALSVDVPYESWLAARTASIASNMPLKTYLGHFLRFCRPLKPDGTLTEPIPVANDKDATAS